MYHHISFGVVVFYWEKHRLHVIIAKARMTFYNATLLPVVTWQSVVFICLFLTYPVSKRRFSLCSFWLYQWLCSLCVNGSSDWNIPRSILCSCIQEAIVCQSTLKEWRIYGVLWPCAWLALFDSRTRLLKTVGFAGCHLCTDGWVGRKGLKKVRRGREGTPTFFANLVGSLKVSSDATLTTLSSQIVYGWDKVYK